MNEPDTPSGERRLSKLSWREWTVVILLLAWLISTAPIVGVQAVVPAGIAILINAAWVLAQLILFAVIGLIGGWKLGLAATYWLLFHIWVPLFLIAGLLALPIPAPLLFGIGSLVPVGIILLSLLTWKLAPRFDDPHLAKGMGVVGIMGGTLWLIVFGVLAVYLGTL
jgi:hypothetical protein